MGQAPKGSARTFTIDDADQQIIKLKRKADPNAEPEDFEEDFVIDDSPHQSPNKVKPKPRPAAASGAAPKKGKQGPVKSTEPQKRGPKPLPPLRKVARAPFKGLPRLAPQPTDLRILRKYDLPTRKAPATHIIYLKPVFQQIPAAQRKKYINDLRTRQRRYRNRQFLNIMHKIDRGRWAKLGTSEWHEEWDLEQLLMGRLKYKVPGTFTARLTTRMQEAGGLDGLLVASFEKLTVILCHRLDHYFLRGLAQFRPAQSAPQETRTSPDLDRGRERQRQSQSILRYRKFPSRTPETRRPKTLRDQKGLQNRPRQVRLPERLCHLGLHLLPLHPPSASPHREAAAKKHAFHRLDGEADERGQISGQCGRRAGRFLAGQRKVRRQWKEDCAEDDELRRGRVEVDILPRRAGAGCLSRGVEVHVCLNVERE